MLKEYNKILGKTERYIDVLIYIFLGLAVISSQYSIATSSIGVGGLIILTTLKIIFYKQKISIDKNILIIFGIFILIQITSSILSEKPHESFMHIFRRISIYIVFFSSILFFDLKKNIKYFLIIFILFTALISTIEIIRFLNEYISNNNIKISEYRLQFYGYPITNAEIKMSILLIIVPFIMIKSNYLINKFFMVLLSLPILISLYLTNARNAILGLLAGIIISGVTKNRKLLLILILISALFLIFAPMPLKERIISVTDMNHPSNKSRIVMWETGIKIIKDNLIFGIGDIDINEVYKKYKTPEFHGEGSHMHNNFIQILVNFGIIGLIIWIILIGYLLQKQISIYNELINIEFENTLVLISITSLAAMLISGLTDWNFGDAEYAAVFWFNFSLAFIAKNIDKNKIED